MKNKSTRQNRRRTTRRNLFTTLALLTSALLTGIMIQACGTSGKAPDAPTESESTPAADPIGEALFLDTRFSEFFAANMTGVNAPLASGDPILNQVANSERSAARSLCRAVDQLSVLPLCH